MQMEEKTLSSELRFDGRILHVFEDDILLPDGQKAKREHITHVGAVCILPLTDDGQVVLERQFRYPFREVIVEIPAGKLERGEDPYPAALRELREETGGYTERLEYLGDYYGSAGFCDEKLTLYFARVEKTGENDPDEDECLTVERYPLPAFEAMITRGEIVDGITLRDNISQLTHIVGGICGALLGISMRK